jgi:hypothetical protein
MAWCNRRGRKPSRSIQNWHASLKDVELPRAVRSQRERRYCARFSTVNLIGSRVHAGAPRHNAAGLAPELSLRALRLNCFSPPREKAQQKLTLVSRLDGERRERKRNAERYMVADRPRG